MIVNKDNKPLDVIFDGTLPDQDKWKFQETGLYYFTIQYTKYHGYPLFHTITPTISAFIARGSSLNNINKQLIHKYIERVKYE